MPNITYRDARGGSRTVDVPVGRSVMEGAVANDVPDILAECTGNCACGTCHVFVPAEWLERVGPPNPAEAYMLEGLDNAAANSRLSCQVKVHEGLDGLVVQTPAAQVRSGVAD